MFSFFKKKSPIEKLQAQYDALIQKAYSLSKTNRNASDTKHAEAEEILKEMDKLRKSS